MVYLPREVMDLIFLFHNPYIGIEKKIEDVYNKLDKKLKLTRNGLFTNNIIQISNNNLHKYSITRHDDKNIAQCITEIPQVFVPRKTITKSSYAGKHFIERYRDVFNPRNDNYISNGELIMAMLISKSKKIKGVAKETQTVNFI